MWWFPLLLAPVLAFTAPKNYNTVPEERWLNVRLNQMMASNNDTFPMRFFYNPLSSDNENVVILVGGDWEISSEDAAQGLAVDIARNLRASLFYTEQRYYGQSLPFPDTSVSNLRFLTMDQSLGDLAQFIRYIKSDDFEQGRYGSAKVVLVGCSMGGSLATWSRRAYPHLVQAVVSDGGPLYAREELPEFLEVVTEVLRVRGSEQCVQNLKEAADEIESAITTSVGLGQVSQVFNTCTPLSTSAMDVATFWSAIIEELEVLVWDEIEAVPTACAALASPATATAMQRLATWLEQRRPPTCLETRYTETVAALTNTSLESPQLHKRLGLFVSCGQTGWARSTAAAPLPAAARPTEYHQQLCTDVFSEHFNQAFLQSGISRTNLFFGGKSVPDYVVSVLGRLDPMSPATPIEGGLKTPVYRPEAPRCSALSSFVSSPDEENRMLKLNVMNDIQYFITGVPFAGASRAISSIFLLIGVGFALIV
ncbi:hypothetical protein evm_003511 [Chilo suppressalis]|nr:hypothetical protein evm_003511 [Chilo suppressalis]